MYNTCRVSARTDPSLAFGVQLMLGLYEGKREVYKRIGYNADNTGKYDIFHDIEACYHYRVCSIGR